MMAIWRLLLYCLAAVIEPASLSATLLERLKQESPSFRARGYVLCCQDQRLSSLLFPPVIYHANLANM